MYALREHVSKSHIYIYIVGRLGLSKQQRPIELRPRTGLSSQGYPKRLRLAQAQ